MRSRFFYPHVCSPTIARSRVFAFTPGHPLWKGCRFFAGGSNPGGLRCEDSSQLRGHATLTAMAGTDWIFEKEARRHVVSLDGVAKYVRGVDKDDYSFVGSTSDLPMSVFAWIRPSAIVAGYKFVFGKVLASANNYEWGLWLADGKVSGLIQSPDGNRAGRRWNTALTAGSLYHCGFTYTGSRLATGISVYVDSLRRDDVSDGLSLVGMQNKAAPLTIGAYADPGGYVNAAIGDCGLWGRIITARELSTLANRSDAMLDGALYDPHKISVSYGISQTLRISPWLIRRRRRNAGAR